MADEKTIGFSIQVKGTDSEVGKLQDMKSELSVLEKQFANYTNKSSVHALALQTKMKALTADIAKQQKAIIETAKSSQYAAGSANALMAENKKLVAVLNSLPMDKNSEQFKAIQAQIAANTETLKAYDAEIGRSYRNVGNYGEGIAGLRAELKDATSAQIEALKAFGAGSKEYAEATARAGKLKDTLGDVKEAQKAMATGSDLGKFKNQLGSIGDSLADLDFEEANEKAQVLNNTVKNFSWKGMVDGAKNLGSTLLSLGKSLLSLPIFWVVAGIAAITAAIYAMGTASDKAAQANIDSLQKIGDAYQKLYEFRIKLAEAAGKDIQKIELAQLQSSKYILEQQIQELIKLSEGREFKKASGLTRMLFGGLNEDQRGQLEQLKNSLAEVNNNIAAKRIEGFKKQSDDYKKQTDKSLAEIDKYNDAAKARQEKADAEKLAEQEKFNEEYRKNNENLIRQIEDQQVDLIRDEQIRELARENLRHKRATEEIQALSANEKIKSDALLLEKETFEKNYNEINLKYAAQAKKDNEKIAADELKFEQDRNAEMMEEVNANLTASLNLALDNADKLRDLREKNKVAAREGLIQLGNELGMMLLDNERAQNERMLEQQTQALEQRRETELTALEERLRSGQITEAQFRIEKQQMDKNFAAEDLANKRKAFEDEKKLKRQQVGIELAIELARIASAAAGNQANIATFGAAGVAQYAIQAGIALGRAGIQLAAIDNAKFEQGGVLKGKSHAQGGIPFTVAGQGGFEAEGGEAIISKRATSMFTPLLSAINQAGGGRAFASGGRIPSPVVSNSSSSSISQMLNMEAFASKIVNGINDKKVIQVESDVRGILNRVGQIESDSSF